MRMFSNWVRGAGAGFLLVGAVFGACVDDAGEVDPEVAERKAKGLVLVCHKTGNGKVIPLELPGPAAKAHKAHGDEVGDWGGTCEDAGEQSECNTVEDCPMLTCNELTGCVQEQCVYEPRLAGLEVMSKEGDCHKLVCDGDGGVLDTVDDTDVHDDGIACTADACAGGVPVHTPQVVSCYSGSPETENEGECKGGTQTCIPELKDFGPCEGEVLPTTEFCSMDHLDEDCDGAIDEEGDGCFCGDGYLQAGEVCDDGNTAPNDSCSPSCNKEQCPPGPGTLDQANLTGFDDWEYATSAWSSGQSFTVGKDGILTTIELGLFNPCEMGVTDGVMKVTLSDATDTVLATAELPVDAVASGCGVDDVALSVDAPGPAVFDFSAACVVVASGQLLNMTIVPVTEVPPVCTNSTCTVGLIGESCSYDTDCAQRLHLAASIEQYPGGDSMANGKTHSGLDLLFKVNVD